MPFKRNPVGFSPETLGLLDMALTRLWLEQVAIGAALSGADPEIQALLRDKVRRLSELGMRFRPGDRDNRSSE